MAKRIIKVGKYNKITCDACECEFSFDAGDVEEAGSANPGKVICPQCQNACTPVTKQAN